MRKEKPFYLKNALPLVSIDFHTLRHLVLGDDVGNYVPN